MHIQYLLVAVLNTYIHTYAYIQCLPTLRHCIRKEPRVREFENSRHTHTYIHTDTSSSSVLVEAIHLASVCLSSACVYSTYVCQAGNVLYIYICMYVCKYILCAIMYKLSFTSPPPRSKTPAPNRHKTYADGSYYSLSYS